MTHLATTPAVSTFRASHLVANRYRLQQRLATKQWGKVYLAEDCQSPASKAATQCIVYHLERLSTVPNYVLLGRDLFPPEAQILKLAGHHAQIPTCHDFFEQENGFYWVQAAVHGEPLSRELETAPWSPEQVVVFLREVLEPLAWVHRHGGQHGNLKPENLVRRADTRQLTLIDFQGLVQIQLALLAMQGIEVPRSQAARRGYQPLEQLQGLTCAASDIYAVGMMAVQALTGKLPTTFPINPATVEILWQSHLPPAPETPLRSHLVAVLHDMVQWDVSRRFANADQVLQCLDAFAPVVVAPPAADNACTITVQANPVPAEMAPRPRAIATTTPQPPTAVGAPSVSDSAIALAPRPTLKTLLLGAFTHPSLYLGLGGLAVASTCAVVGWGMLTSVDFNDQTYALWQRLQRAMGGGEPARQEYAQALGQRWWQDWQTAANAYQAAEQAFQEGRLLDAQQAAAAMPNIPFWRDRWQGLAHHVIAKAETEANQLLQTAYDYARERRFNRAIAELDQIVPGTRIAALAQTKKAEYRQKQTIKAWADLQKAYDQATVRDFSNAMTYLYQIPANTPAYAIAQHKISEYRQKEKIRAQFLLNQANSRARQQNLLSAITTLNNAPIGTELDPVVDARIKDYTTQLNQRAAQLLQLAKQQQALGQRDMAQAMLCQIPLGTTAYAEARDLLASPAFQTQVPNAIATATAPPKSLNPGGYLREASAIALTTAPDPTVK